ncbi:MAG: tetratricopeptide repeat protein [Bryobacteraceae bacterium]|jgi:tetratricopeptide (TPR) repeat protein
MKKSKRAAETTGKGGAGAGAAFEIRPWHYALALAAALVAVLEAYGPALRGQFVFDDAYLPMAVQDFSNAPLRLWVGGVRPLLMFSFWVNYRLYDLDPLSYHLFNVLCHFATSVLVFLVARRVLTWAGTGGFPRAALAAFAGGVFLLHPVQTESVAYVASRSEVLSGLFFCAAWVVFLYRRSDALSWPAAAAVLILFGAAVSSKEHAAVLPLLLLATDYYWNPGFSLQGIRRNWRLYALLAAGVALALRVILGVLRGADTAGFALKDLTWVQYFFTQCRVIWVYIRLFFLPYGQTVDYDFAVSHNLLEHGAVLGLIGLAALAAAAVYFRRRYPLASYGYFVFLILLAPTSSVLPIIDPIAERRMYLPILGLLLMALEFLRRWKVRRGTLAVTLAGCVLLMGALTRLRSQVWSNATALWEDAAAKSPRKQRVQEQLGFAYYAEGRCQLALERYQAAARVARPDYRLLVEWAGACDCLNRLDEALAKLRQAAALSNTAHVNSEIGRVYVKQGKRAEALAALNAAVRLNPRFEATYVYRGVLYANSNEWEAAAAEYRRALSLDPSDQQARSGLAEAERRLKGSR